MSTRPYDQKKKSIEAARAGLKAKTSPEPIAFPPDDPGDPGFCSPEPSVPKRRGRPRKTLSPELAARLPEQSDNAYLQAQAQLRAEVAASGAAPAVVPPSDYHRGGPKLAAEELERIIDLYTEKYGPILSLDEAADVTKLAKQTLRRQVCEGKFTSSCYRGKPLRFITRRLLEEVLG